MFLPNNSGLLAKRAGMNVYGEPSFAKATKTPCGVVRLNTTSQKTSVRADSSASRGAADELVSDAKILFPATALIDFGDRFEISGMVLRVIKVEPRYAVPGHLDHYEVDFEHWPE